MSFGQSAVGIAYFRINGVQYRLAGNVKIMTLSEKRTPLVGMDGNVAPQIEFQSPGIEVDLRDHQAVDLQALALMQEETVTAELANGTVWELSQAFYAGDGELDAKEGTFQVRFHGQRIRRIKG